MSALKFVDSHNMVVFLAEPTETVLGYCKVKTVNGEVQLQALVDGKKVIITETSVRRDLQLEDAEGIECLPNVDIFEQLTLMGAKSTAWNKFSSTMASAIICLATNQKFNFSKYIFESMVKNVDSSVKFLMYPRFVQVFLVKQVGDMSTHDEIFVTPSHTKKVFGNMKRVGKGFSRAVTPLFPTMMYSQQETRVQDEAINEENVPTHSNDPLLSGEDRLKLKELMTLCTNLQNMVLDLEHTKTTQALEIDNLKRRVKKLEKKQWSRNYGLRRLLRGKKEKIMFIKSKEFVPVSAAFNTKGAKGKEEQTTLPKLNNKGGGEALMHVPYTEKETGLDVNAQRLDDTKVFADVQRYLTKAIEDGK
ncbi:hypothetical protein Tco_0589879 [Tanacetum coccineum]